MVGAAIAAASLSPRAERALAAASTSSQFEGLPPRDTVEGWLQQMVSFGPRFTGAPAHDAFIDFLDSGFRDLGLTTYRERQTFTRWLAQRWSLEILDGPGAGPVSVASYYSYSGATPVEGVTGELVYLGAVPAPSLPGNPLNLPADQAALARTATDVNADIAARLAAAPGGVAGRIVLMDAPIPGFPFGALYADATYVYDPAGTLATEDFKRAGLLIALPPLQAFAAAGAVGVVFAVDASAENAAGQYAPFIEPLQNTPALLVDRDVGRTLRGAAAKGARVRLTLVADETPNVGTDTLWTMLQGVTDEIMIVNTHTDGPNAVEENGGLAVLALANHFAALPQSARKRTLVFSCVTGHFAAAVSSTPAWIGNHQDLVGKAAAALAVEHFGCLDWRDDPVLGYGPTGLVEPGIAFHSDTPIVACAARSIADYNIDRTALLRPVAVSFLGEGAALHESGVPTIGFVPAPNYLLSFADDQHIDKVDRVFLYRQIEWAADFLHRLEGVPAAVLKAGDSAILPSELGYVLPVE